MKAGSPDDSKYKGRRVVGWMISFDRNADGAVFTLREGRNVLGRDADECDVAVNDDEMVSSRHAVVAIRAGKARISDDRSQNGTFLNEEDVFEWTELKDGDTVTVIKDLKVKGASSSVKVGTKVKNIRLVEGDHDIDCRIEGFGQMGLKSEFVRKVSG